ncbi:MAG: DUF885 domain-containing protein [Litorimonas sp.]
MRKTSLLIMFCLAAPLSLQACAPKQQDRETLVASESAQLNAWFEQRFEETLSRSPMSQTSLGHKTQYDKLDDISQLALDETATLQQVWLDEMRRDFDIDRLDPQTKLSFKLFEFDIEDRLASHAQSQNAYVFQHMGGPHSNLPSFMINNHKIDTIEDARAYIARLNAFPQYLKQAQDRTNTQFENGVSLPKFVYAKLSQTSRNIISGAPFENPDEASEVKDSPLWNDFKTKLAALNLPQGEYDDLAAQAEAALRGPVQTAYTSLLSMFEIHSLQATSDDGVWKLPQTENYYAAQLKHYTTTDLSADEIHQIGLDEVARIQDQMRQIMTRLNFDGDLKNFFEFLRTDPQFIYSNDAQGRDAYIQDATQIINDMANRLDDLFITKPKADVRVKRVEAFREDTAFGAFYDPPALDGSRPGTYYINLKDVAEQPKYLQQALAYHEGIPGHHMQIALAMELADLPKFRTFGRHTAYIEGWALYAESVPAELGLYTDPYSEFGRLSMEIFRAARLVVDTGIHSKKWTRKQAVQYYLDNIPNPEGDIRAEIDRYIVWPGQATAYKIGMLKIQALRMKAEETLGENFNIAEFHDVILANGSMPLEILEQLVDDWIDTQETD